MNPTSETPRTLTSEGPGPVAATLVPHTHDERRIMRRPPPGEWLTTRIQRDPGPALLIAACAGFVVGRLVRYAFRSLTRKT